MKTEFKTWKQIDSALFDEEFEEKIKLSKEEKGILEKAIEELLILENAVRRVRLEIGDLLRSKT